MTSRNSDNKSKRILLTGGAGFIGRWTAAAILSDTPHELLVVDDLSNGSRANLEALRAGPRFTDFIVSKIENTKRMEKAFDSFKPDVCVHLAAQINVQDSIDNPGKTFESDVRGTFDLLEMCRARKTKFVFMSTCMVYDKAAPTGAVAETHPVLPRSPYAAAKLAGEQLTLSYFHAYGLPTVVLRPFNTYGPYQKSSGEGGVVSIFVSRVLKGETLNIYGTGKQTRDLLFVEDCADFILKASFHPKAVGCVLNAATGRDVTVNELAKLTLKICDGESTVKHVKHIHPQSEIMKLCGDPALAARRIGWRPKTDLETGVRRTMDWMRPD